MESGNNTCICWTLTKRKECARPLFIALILLFLSPSIVHSKGKMSEPKYKNNLKVEFVRVPMRDGVELAAKIVRPDAEGRFPGVMMYYPYRFLNDSEDLGFPWPVGPTPYLAARGYAVVQYEVRGTGNSGGWTKDIYSADERRDGYEMVEWIADQPWCNGNVGMMGISYGGVVQWQVAVQAPPSLKAIIVRSANDDVYTEWTYPGGVLRPYMFDTFSPLMTASNLLPPNPDITGPKWSEIWQERLQKSEPWGIGYISNQQQGPYWQDRSLSKDFNRVKCAVYVIGGWSDCYPTALLRAYSNLKVPKRALIGPWGHWWPEVERAVPGPRIQGGIEYVKWFDYWLKGIDNGVMDEPPVTIFVKKYKKPSARMYVEEPGSWRSEREWPIARTRPTPLYFHADGRLSREEDATEGRDEYEYNPIAGLTSGMHWGGGVLPWGMPIDQRLDEAFSVTYTTPPLEAELEVTGTPTAVLNISSSAEVAYFRVKLIDVAPDGTSKLVRYGGLNATHRNSHFEPEPLEPGRTHEIKVELKTISYVYAPGHRIRVAVTSADIQNAWPTAQSATNTIHRGGSFPSRIILPAIPRQSPSLPPPDLKILPSADPDILAKPTEYSITRDLVNETATVRLSVDDREYGRLIESSFTVSSKEPANAVLKARSIRSMNRPDMEVQVEANEVTTSDRSAFHHVGQVEVRVNGKRHTNKSWSVTVPRKLN